ncbi:5,10-methylenetetrahydrofolate reductase [Aliarcobacter butzleri RM4018]|uniref:Methylenetetrahydrofolate reductase n=1 Tax=Aliarcobacter butzleri (strain RM4018) TaxID=367737 RepID=A8ERC3_ALIB4|nr:methylenetetrahydrofolate reductase [Aliarcobacter butzleri]ABV66497.1 5,10-methylenetetrahydrofolate reductase [Aliarcobacter butzleri RM4018]MCG3663535.1 methylenetetrahydrofolate reductase [Aliarcobacter butzleri]MDN5054802.1 methylenetetrahydrofolate reductase [Aliarcobacter butzleri]SNV23596.1 bifunctional homocysteine S-methyltransferase/5,10-methylenetetrahydrofolate reductase protein [Aliarcobacter butzleri]GGT71285.1 methylenetetrahydrofolate reductase [Aliarcobacter butzleri]
MFKTLIQKLQEDKYLTLETTPQHEPSMHNIIEKIKKFNLQDKIDGFSCTDNPLAKLRYNSLFAALKLQQEFEKPVIATMTMRDRNKIALQSDLLGANDFDVRAILALTGDPAKMSDQPNSKGVFEANSLMLLKMIKSFNYGMDFAGHPFKIEPKQIFPFAVVNSYAKNFSSLEKKLHLKIQNGAIGIITQPIFDIENAQKLLESFDIAKENVEGDKRKSQLIFGIFPVTKLRTALFLSAQVPGIHVPQFWIDALEKAHSIGEEEEYKVGMELSSNLFKELNKLHPKIHLMTANRFDVANEIIS